MSKPLSEASSPIVTVARPSNTGRHLVPPFGEAGTHIHRAFRGLKYRGKYATDIVKYDLSKGWFECYVSLETGSTVFRYYGDYEIGFDIDEFLGIRGLTNWLRKTGASYYFDDDGAFVPDWGSEDDLLFKIRFPGSYLP